MTFAELAEGLVLFALVVAAALTVAWILTTRVFGYLRGSARGVCHGLLATTALVAFHLLPGAAGVLSRWSVLACALAAAVAAWRLVPAAATRRAAPRGFEVSSSRLSWALALGGAGLLALWSLAALYDQWGLPSTGIDTLTHHLPNVAAWIQSGTLWRIDQYAPLLANGAYPHHGDLVFLAAVLPWENDAFVRPMNWPFVALTGLGAYAIAAELRAPRAAGVAFAGALCATPIVAGTAQSGAMTDPIMIAALAAGILFLLRHLRERRRADLVLGGIGLGVALGTKWYGVSSAVVVAAVWAAAALLAGRGWRRGLADLGLLTGVALAVGGFWLVRNWVELGNPLFPARIEVFGLTVFDAPPDIVRERYGATVLDYLLDGSVMRDWIIPAWRHVLNVSGLAIALGTLAALTLAARAARRGRGAATMGPLALAAMAVLLAAAYAITPDTALGPEGMPVLAEPNARYVVPALVAGAGAAAWAAGRMGRLRILLELLAFAAVVQGIRRGFALDRVLVAQVLVVVLALAIAVRLGGRMLSATEGTRRRVAGASAAALVVTAAVAVADERQRAFNTGRYSATGDAALDWIAANAPAGRRIGIAGQWDVRTVSPVWPAFGPRIGNHVEFMGETVEGQLRHHRSPAAFASALRERRVDLLLVGRHTGTAPVRGDSRFDRWARAAGFERVVQSWATTLYRAPVSEARRR